MYSDTHRFLWNLVPEFLVNYEKNAGTFENFKNNQEIRNYK